MSSNKKKLFVIFKAPSGEQIKASFMSDISDKDEKDVLWYYKENWCLANLFYYEEIISITVDGNEVSLSDLKKMLNLPQEDDSENLWSFNPEIDVYFSKDFN